MFIRQLSYLIALDRHRHFGRAAKSCHVSQPALSNALRELEAELGIAIVKRNRSFQGITEEGERVITWARQVLASLDGLRQEADLVRSVPGGHLAIGAVPTAIRPGTLLGRGFREAIPGLTLEIRSLATAEILDLLRKQELHFGMLHVEMIPDGMFERIPLYTERYVLVSDGRHGLPGRLDWSQLGQLPLCLLSPDMHSRHMLDRSFARHAVTPTVVVETNTVRVLMSEAAAGHCCSIMPLGALTEANRLVRIHRIQPELTAELCLARLKRGSQPPLVEAAWQRAAMLDLQETLEAPLRRGGEQRKRSAAR